jgi:hypothetical protein
MNYEECLDQCAKDVGWDDFDDLRRNHFHLETVITTMSLAAELYKKQ